MGGTPKVAETQDLPDLDYARHAESLGLRGFTMKSLDDVNRVWMDTLASGRPVLIDAKVDPNVVAFLQSP